MDRTATSVATAATRFSGSPRHAASSVSPSGITLAPGSASAAAQPSPSFQTSSVAADSPPDVAAAWGYAPITVVKPESRYPFRLPFAATAPDNLPTHPQPS